MLNRATLIGRLGGDPELRRTDNHAICRFSIATDVPGREDPDWHAIVVWDKQAEICARNLSKGRLVYVEGPIRTNRWTDDDGIKRYKTEIHAFRVQFLDAPRDGGGSSSSGRDERRETHGPGGHRRAFDGRGKR